MSSLACSEAGGGGDVYDGAVGLAVALLGEGLDSLGARELAARLGDVECTIRKLEAVAVSVVAEADRREVFRDDGHVSVRGWVKAPTASTRPPTPAGRRQWPPSARWGTSMPVSARPSSRR